MATIRTAIELQDNFTGILYQVFDAVNMSISAMEEMNQTMNASVDTTSFEAARNSINQATIAVQEMEASMHGISPAIDENTQRQEQFNRVIRDGTDNVDDMSRKIKGAVAAYVGIAGIRKAFSFVEDCTEAFNTQLNAENQLIGVLANMLDEDYVAQFELEVTADTTAAVSEVDDIHSSVGEVVVPVSAETMALNAAFDEITAKAAEIQSKGIYGDETMIAAAAEFSTYFSDTDAIKVMMDTLSDYAMGMSGGGEVATQQMVDYATNLGKIMSGSYDAMTKKGFELSDTQKAIIEGTATQEQIVAALGEEYLTMSQDMQAAAAISQVVEESWAGLYENMSNTPEGRIVQMTNTWGDMKEMIGGQLYPYVLLFVNAIMENWGSIEGIVQGITTGLKIMISVLSWVLEAAIAGADVIIDNWGWIGPIFYAVAGAVAVYYGWQVAANAVQLISKGIHIAMAAVQMAHAAALGVLTATTAGQIAAQNGLNAAMYASPVMWLVIAMIALGAVVLIAANHIANMGGTAETAFGVICGGVNVGIQFFKNFGLLVANVALGIGNAIAALGSNMMVSFHNAICSIQSWFYDLLYSGVVVIEGICAALNKLPFVSFDYSGISDAADDYAAKSAEAAGNKDEYQSISDAFLEGWSTFDVFQDGWIEDAYDAGAKWGDGVSDKVSDMITPEEFNYPDLSNYGTGLADGVDELVENTGAIRDGLEMTEEDLKYLRDIAEQETVNRFTTAEITIEQTNHNNISGKMDLDGVVDGLTDAVNEAVDMIAEGVHT